MTLSIITSKEPGTFSQEPYFRRVCAYEDLFRLSNSPCETHNSAGSRAA